MSTPTFVPPGAPPAPLPAGWYPDPLDWQLRRYFDGARWTFWTSDPARQQRVADEVPQVEQAPAAPVGLRDDIAAASAAAGALLGAGKEIRMLESRLRSEERVVALAAAVGAGTGVLACTNQRLLFLFVGIVRSQFLEVDWNQAKSVFYALDTKAFEVYTVRRTKRAVPAFVVTVPNRDDAMRVAHAAEASSAAPRLDMV